MNRNFLILFLSAFILLACAPTAQITKTSIKATVLDDLGNPVEGATILLYANEQDYRSSKNPVAEKAMTNKKGEAKISDLEAKAYFIDVRKGDLNNNGAGVEIDALQAGRVNKINIIIE